MTGRGLKRGHVNPAAQAKVDELAPLLGMLGFDSAMLLGDRIVWSPPAYSAKTSARAPFLFYDARRPGAVIARFPDGRREKCGTIAEVVGAVFRILSDCGMPFGVRPSRRRGRPRKAHTSCSSSLLKNE